MFSTHSPRREWSLDLAFHGQLPDHEERDPEGENENSQAEQPAIVLVDPGEEPEGG
jgi:hypothetical protein